MRGGKRPNAGRKKSEAKQLRDALKPPRKRAHQGCARGLSPMSGTAPPKEYQWRPGQSGNPGGGRSAGTTLREWINLFCNNSLKESDLRKIARDKAEPWPRRAAAERVLRTMEAGDLADMQAWLDGEADLKGLRRGGINTEVIKRAKIKRKIVYVDKNSGETTEVEEREIELHDRAGLDFDRIADRTEGKPTQRLEVDAQIDHTPDAIVLVHTAPPVAEGE